MSGGEIKITFLGTGSAIPPIGRQQVSFALRHSKGLILFDCGEGTQYSLRKYKISTRKEFVICLSHLHSDHFLGVPGLLSSLELLGREEEVKVVGPKGTKNTIENIIKAYYIQLSFKLEVIELQPDQYFTGNGYELSCFKALHKGNCLSFIFRENNLKGKVDITKAQTLGILPGPLISELQNGKNVEVEGKIVKPEEIVGPSRSGRIIVYSGDTSYNEEFLKLQSEKIDLLIHEATYPKDLKKLAIERGHSTITDAVDIASKLNVPKLIITHISPRYENLENDILEAKEIFGNLILAVEGLEYLISLSSRHP